VSNEHTSATRSRCSVLARLRERWQMRGRAAELARWHAGYRSGCTAQPIPMLKAYRLVEVWDVLQERERVWELVAWNRGRAKLAWFRSNMPRLIWGG
jgi:hypothetical protein